MQKSWTRFEFLNSQLYRSRRHLRIYSDAPRKGDDMACLGVHFALTPVEAEQLREFGDESSRLNFVQETIEDLYFASQQDLIAETDKAWDAIHRALTDGRLSYENGEYPLNHVILGGQVLYFQSNYIMSLKSPPQVQDIAQAIAAIDERQLRTRYFTIDEVDYGFPLSEEDFQYTWHWFNGLRAFFNKVSVSKRFVLFTADQ